jgi:DNA-binding MarR family transcriptional regulator
MDMGTEESSRLIVEFYERLTAWESTVVRDSGLTTAQNHAIEIVGHAGAIQMKDLAIKIGVTTGTLTVAVDRLEEKNLLKRVSHQTDRRSYLIELTEAGRKVFEKHHALHLDLTRNVLESLTDEEKSQFRLLLKKVSEAIPVL